MLRAARAILQVTPPAALGNVRTIAILQCALSRIRHFFLLSSLSCSDDALQVINLKESLNVFPEHAHARIQRQIDETVEAYLAAARRSPLHQEVLQMTS